MASSPLATNVWRHDNAPARISGVAVVHQYADRSPLAIVYHDAPDVLRSEAFLGQFATLLTRRLGGASMEMIEAAMRDGREEIVYCAADVQNGDWRGPSERMTVRSGHALDVDDVATRAGVSLTELARMSTQVASLYEPWRTSFPGVQPVQTAAPRGVAFG